jgi:FkbM family methyltransferase
MLIDLPHMVRKHRIRAKGVLHLGASEGQEAEAYHRQGWAMAFVEAIPEVYEKLKENTAKYNAVCYNACVSNQEGEVTFNIANNGGQSSSMLEFGTHKDVHPSVLFVDKITLKTIRAEHLVKDIERYDVLAMDLQGAELLALEGLGDKINGFDYVYTEVNAKELYKGCAQIKDLDRYLLQKGFQRFETKMTPWGWGDALYKRVKQFNRERKEHRNATTFDLRPSMPVVYPSNNVNDFEHWFADNYKGGHERQYLSVMWTAYQLRHDKNGGAKAYLQSYIDSLDRSAKYFTIVQHDDGIMCDLSKLDIKVFAMSGNRIDYPLPLIAEPYPYTFDLPRDIFASFIGAKTHNVRRLINPGQNYVLQFSHVDPEKYCETMARSIFALCPRGYGANSFRISEAMQYGAIPVYISDQFIFPHNVDFEKFGVVIGFNDVRRLDQILRAIKPDEIKRKQEAVKEYYQKYFTYQSTFDLIVSNL